MSLEVAVRRRWKDFALDVSFSCAGGERLGILGASGSGKSMTLKCVAGIQTPKEGRIVRRGEVLLDSGAGVNQKPQERRVGYLFQNYALFPHMRVEENIACALGRLPKNKRGARVEELLRRFRLEGMGGRYPGQLSGGQQQRVALARILAQEPETLLLDEPFSALDAYLREQLQMELLDMLEDFGGEVVMVTHSRDEVYHLCGRLVVLEQGRCVASGPTRELFRNPQLLTVARLTGCKNISRAKKVEETQIYAQDWGLALTAAGPIPPGIDGVGIRAHDLHPAAEGEVNAFSVAVKSRLESPFEWNLMVTGAPGGGPIWWKIAKDAYRGTPDYLRVDPEKILLLRSEPEADKKGRGSP